MRIVIGICKTCSNAIWGADISVGILPYVDDCKIAGESIADDIESINENNQCPLWKPNISYCKKHHIWNERGLCDFCQIPDPDDYDIDIGGDISW